MEIVKFRHDSLNVSVINYFKKDKIIPLMQHKIYEFLMTEVDNDTKKQINIGASIINLFGHIMPFA